MKTLRHVWLVMTSLMTFGPIAVAEDIDLFLGIQGQQPQAANVLLVLDNSSNFNATAGVPLDTECAEVQSKLVGTTTANSGDPAPANRCGSGQSACSLGNSRAVPGNFQAQLTNGGATASLTWSDVTYETYYEIQRQQLVNGVWSAGDTYYKNANSTTLTDSPGPGTYRYQIRGVIFTGTGNNNTRQFSAWSSLVEVTITASLPGTATTGAIEQCAMYKVLKGLPSGRVRVGIMVYNASQVVNYQNQACTAPASNSFPGGCLVYPMTLIRDADPVAGTPDTRLDLLNYIKEWRTSNNVAGKWIGANNQQTGAVLQEAWAYLSASAASPRRGLSGNLYSTSPVSSGACTTNSYVVFVGNSFTTSGTPGDSAGVDTALLQETATTVTTDMHPTPRGLSKNSPEYSELTSLVLGTRETSCLTNAGAKKSHSFASAPAAHATGGEYADEWSRYMRDEAGIVSYTVGLIKPSACAAPYPALMASIAEKGGGRYFEVTDYDGLVISLTEIFSSILAVNSVFASVSLPISVNNQDTYLNQVYIGMFRPDAETEPRWSGNLKQYQLGFVAGSGDQQIELKDADGDPALSSSGTGFIDACARSLWTPTTPDAYWPATEDFENCVDVSGSSNAPDGPIVEKGGVGQQVRSMTPSTRNLWTCGSTCDQVVQFNASNANLLASASLLNACTDTTNSVCAAQARTTLIDWQRGLNNNTSDLQDNFRAATEMRPSVHGDVVHSRPRAINFGPKENPRIVVFYGANDGTLRAINGNQAGTVGGKPPGGEIWSFMPREFEDEIARMRANYPLVKFEGINQETGRSKPYGFDGPVSAWIEQTSTEVTKAVIFASMRRGGRMVYAFDIKSDDPAASTYQGLAPASGAYGANPQVKWRFGCDDAGTCTNNPSTALDNDLANEIGQTWSAPQIVKTQTGTYIVMGGGYDPCEDTDSLDNPCSGGSALGRRVFVLNADTGQQVREFTTSRPVAADVFVVPYRIGSTETGLANHLYVTDLGGNLYRITGANRSRLADPANWEMTPVARFGCDAGLGSGCNRKFFYPPDVLTTSYGYALLLGSGDREKPLPSYASATQIQNYFFMVKDNLTNPLWLCPEQLSGTSCAGNDYIEFSDLAAVDPNAQVAPADLALSSNRGWYLPLGAKEQVVTSALTVFGVTVFSTHTPTNSGDTCSPNLGIAQAYQVLYESAIGAVTNDDGSTQRNTRVDGGGLPPSPVAGQVEIDGKVVAFVIGAAGRSALEARAPNLSALPKQPKGRRYWYIER